MAARGLAVGGGLSVPAIATAVMAMATLAGVTRVEEGWLARATAR